LIQLHSYISEVENRADTGMLVQTFCIIKFLWELPFCRQRQAEYQT